MTFLRNTNLGEELLAHARQLVECSHSRDAFDTARDYAGRAGTLASQTFTSTRQRVRGRRGLGIAIGVSIGLGAIAAAYLLARRKALTQDEYDEHDPTRYRPTNASGDALDGSGEDNPVPGETGLY